jgi:hypothetical protein
MKNALITIALLIVFSLAIQSCGEDKKNTEAPKTEQAPEVTEQTGDAPVAEETDAPAEEAAAEVKPSGLADNTYKPPIMGKIVSLSGLVHGDGTVNKAEAAKMVEKAIPLMFKADAGSVCMVYNADGSYAGKKLVKYASNKKIGIIGQVKTVNGVKIIIADKIESME